MRERVQLYMCLGGIPKYLEQIDPRESLARNLNRLCFTANGFFTEEYETLFKEQFRSLKVYQSIVESLARSPASMSDLAAGLKLLGYQPTSRSHSRVFFPAGL